MTDAKYLQAAIGRCYQFCFSILEQIDGDRNITAKLCHGIPTLTKTPHTKFGHAWIEFEVNGVDGIGVIDHRFPKGSVMRDTYYAIGNIDPATVVRYTMREARKLVVRSKHYGPWDETVSSAFHAGM